MNDLMLGLVNRSWRKPPDDEPWLACSYDEYMAVMDWYHGCEVFPLQDKNVADYGYVNVVWCGRTWVPDPSTLWNPDLMDNAL